jgi:membrane protease YdiL (CAAX protease family)
MSTARRLRLEVAIVLGLSLGASAVYSIVSLIAKLTEERALGDQTVALNPSRSSREWLDFTYQFLDVFFGLFVVGLALYLLWTPGGSPFRRIGFDLTRPGRDAASGLLLVAVIGVPGLALYGIGRALGVTVAVQTSPADWFWWTVPILVLRALEAALTEEIIVVGYLFTRFREFGVGPWATILSSALLRGSTMPLVVAHWILDIVSFVGYPLAVGWWPALFTVPAD